MADEYRCIGGGAHGLIIRPRADEIYVRCRGTVYRLDILKTISERGVFVWVPDEVSPDQSTTFILSTLFERNCADAS